MITESEAGDARGNWCTAQHSWINLLPVLGAYFLLAHYKVGSQSLWNDEVLSLWNARVNEPLFLSSVWSQYHGPLYFALLHFWAKLGTSEATLRTLSALIGGTALCLMYALGRSLFNPSVALITSVLVATSPFFIWYSQEVRYVTLMIAASVFSMWALWQALSSKTPAWWLVYAGSVALALFTFVTCVFLIPTHGAILALSGLRRQILLKWIALQIPLFAIFVWWASHTFYKEAIVDKSDDNQQSASINLKALKSGNKKELSLAVVPYTFFAFSTGFSVGPSLQELHISQSFASLRPYAPQVALAGILFGGIFLWGLVSLWRRPGLERFLVLSLILPVAGALLAAAMTSMTYNVRYVAMVFPAFFLIMAAGISGLRKFSAQIAVLIIILLANSYSLANYYLNPKYAREDTRSAAQYLESVTRVKDVILIIGSQNGLRYYYKGGLPVLWWGHRDVIDNRQVTTKLLNDLRHEHDRLWLVTVRPWERDPKGKVKALLDEAYSLTEEKQFVGVGVYCYELAQPGAFSRFSSQACSGLPTLIPLSERSPNNVSANVTRLNGSASCWYLGASYKDCCRKHKNNETTQELMCTLILMRTIDVTSCGHMNLLYTAATPVAGAQPRGEVAAKWFL